MATSAKNKGTSDSMGPFKDEGLSYSDFMRNLAAKYNDSETQNHRHLFDIKSKMVHNTFPFSNLFSDSEGPSSFFPNSNPILASLAAVSGQTHLLQRPQVQSHLLQTFMSSGAATKRKMPSELNKIPLKIAKKSKVCQTVIPCSDESNVIQNWSVKEVCDFVESIEICRPFVHAFREQSIDGLALLLLTEDHLLHQLSMTLGPVLKFKAVLSSRIGACPSCLHCMHCHDVGDVESREEGGNKVEEESAS